MIQKHSVINFCLFQAVWFTTLLLEEHAIFISCTVILIMFYLSKQKTQDIILLITALPLAIGLELLSVYFNLITFKTSFIPLWLVLLWAALLLCINSSMALVTRIKPPNAFIICMLFAPLSYLGAANFGAFTLSVATWQFYLVYGFLWASVFCCILQINNKIKTYLVS
ncbi:DUF2878 domain-containing protein [Pseudoalteromonas sp. MMG010]|uniref:DUF2878 domain-containing protein n=1 Tax=Pseudoalteromonas sp. MMG010 TaxID=2822685 RepID=UPI001B3A50EB|nr:DUF2878 domain-containing protein [Pseudoalteromonas sp. MMG010]MBQ4833421.1 DUF2878 domain-containing protein [Pseudoalteromonas sp. MMG010]